MHTRQQYRQTISLPLSVFCLRAFLSFTLQTSLTQTKIHLDRQQNPLLRTGRIAQRSHQNTAAVRLRGATPARRLRRTSRDSGVTAMPLLRRGCDRTPSRGSAAGQAGRTRRPPGRAARSGGNGPLTGSPPSSPGCPCSAGAGQQESRAPGPPARKGTRFSPAREV